MPVLLSPAIVPSKVVTSFFKLNPTGRHGDGCNMWL